MADPVGVALGAVSLATALSGIFVSLVECFEYVELGRRFDKDFDKCQARLAALKLQITRWGISTGAFPDPQTGQRRLVSVDAQTSAAAKRLLSAIRDDVLEVEEKSKAYLGQSARQPLVVMGEDDMDESTRALSAQANTIVTRRVQGVSWTRKTKWAVYQKKLFDRLLEDIAENFGHLERLLPQLAESQQKLCRVEAEAVWKSQSEPAMELLHDASEANEDKLLEEAVRDVIVSRGSGHRWEKTTIEDEVKLHQGDQVASGFRGRAPLGRIGHNYGVTVATGQSVVTQGDIYR